MKVLTLGSKVLVDLFKLVGVDGRVVDDESSALKVQSKLDDLSNLAMIVISSQAADWMPKIINRARDQQVAILVIDAKSNRIESQVEKVLGIKLKQLAA